MIAREQKREKLIFKHRKLRTNLKELIKSSNDVEEIINAQTQLAKLPVDSSPSRHSTRCKLCGRSHAVYRKFELCRICFRQQLMAGNIPGGRKSSW